MTLRQFISGIGRAAIPVLALAFLQFALVHTADARPGVVTPRVVPPSSHPYGHTYGEWSALYFQSLLENPFDPEAYSMGQLGHVLFLAATPGGPPVEFRYEVGAGTAFLVDVGAAAFWVPDDFPPGTPIEELRAAAASIINLVTVAECVIDGVPVSNVWGYRTVSPVFYGYLNPINPWGLPGDHPIGPAVVDGFWIMIPPLGVGPHEIYFHQIVGDPGNPFFEGEVTHFVTVVPGTPGKGGDALAVEPTTWGAIKAQFSR